jgi:hypothetical protein
MKLSPIIKTSESNDLEDIFFQVTLIVDKDNNLVVIDDSQSDWTDFVDCGTLIMKTVVMRP